MEAQSDLSDRLRAHQFRVIVFDWDGTAVTSRQEDASELALLVKALLAHDVWIVVVTGTNFKYVERQLCQRIEAVSLRHLLVCTNRGSEVYAFDRRGRTVRLWLRTATLTEEMQLSAIADSLRDEITARAQLELLIVYDRLNRRKVDLIPLQEWDDPPKSRLDELLAAVEHRFVKAGWTGGLGSLINLAREVAMRQGLSAVRITSDVKHIEIGLTDKGDAIDWVKRNLLDPQDIALRDVLLIGDEFGPIAAGFTGSDDRMREQAGPEALVVSVGPEPHGVHPGVLHLGGGPTRFRAVLAEQLQLHQQENAARLGSRPTFAAPTLVRARTKRADENDWLEALLSSPEEPTWSVCQLGYWPTIEHEVESRLTSQAK